MAATADLDLTLRVFERSHLEVLRTDTPLSADLIESRKNRHEEWFYRPAGHIDIANVPLPVRLVK